ncbi:hypothetical protein AB0I72_00770 [Nocardiopsis sp. NPDC049922]|uniref:hypothetical protein n=1 Tax=Nocardiopsis sp. NPDC049922 TaxID=3155157 RepID=UPI00340A8B46
MRKFTAALIAVARAYAKALLTPARGRHSAAARRRRSTRVRPYAPVPEQAIAPTRPSPSALPSRPATPVTLAAPTVEAPVAADVALVRPYYVAHERELARATERPRSWSASTVQPIVPSPRVPLGDLLAAP